MVFALSPTSVNSNFSLSDSLSDIATLDMRDDYNQTAPNEEDFPSRPVYQEGSLNSSMITIIVSLQGMLALDHLLTDIPG